jgi:hypothetical protein
MESGATWFDVECQNHNVSGGCFHRRKCSIVHAVADGDLEVRTRCALFAYGAARGLYRVHFREAVNQGGKPTSGIEHHAQIYRYH